MRFVIGMVSVLLTCSSQAELIVFDFSVSAGGNAAGLSLDGLNNGDAMVLGSNFSVTMGAAAATFGGPAGDLLNYTASSPNFGINAGGSGDVTDAIDGGSGFDERLLLNFVPFSGSGPVTMTIVSIEFDRVTDGDEGIVSFGLGPNTAFTDFSLDSSNVLTLNQSIVTSESLEILYTQGNGFGLEAITLNVTVIPEPTTPTLAMLGLGLSLVARRRKRTTGFATTSG